MNKILINIIIILISLNLKLFGQHFPMNLPNYDKKQWHFGFTLGFNDMNFRTHFVDVDEYNRNVLIIEPVSSQGLNVGIVSNKRLVEYLDLRLVPSLSFGERMLRYTIFENDTSYKTYIKNVESTMLDIPLTLKYKSKRLPGKGKNMRVYVLGGLRYSIDFASQKNKKSNNDDIIIKLKPHDFMLTTGVGFDFYFEWFKFGIEIQSSFGMMDILYQENNIFTSNIQKMTSQITWLTFTFE